MTEEIQKPLDKNESADAEASQPTVERISSKQGTYSLVLMSVMLISTLLMVGMQFLPSQKPKIEREVQALREEIKLRKDELERQKASFNLGRSDEMPVSIEALSKEVLEDLKTITTLSQSYEKIIVENQSEIAALRSEIQKNENLYKDLIEENHHLQKEKRKALTTSQETKVIEEKWLDANEQLARMKEQLSAAKKEISELGHGVDLDEFQDLQRQLDENKRAREFFEKQVKELQEKILR